MTKTSKGKKIFLIVLLSVLVLVLLGFMISVIMGFLPIRAFNLASYKVSSQLAYEDVFDASFQEIKVDATLGDIEVLPSTDEKTHIAIYSDSSLFDVEDNDSDLSIVFGEEEGFHFSVPNTKDLIKVYVPVSTSGSFVLESDCGDVTAEEFSNAIFDVTTNMGDVTITGANQIDVDNDMGDITVGTVRNLKVIQDMGDLEVDSISSRLSIENDMGNVFLKEVSLEYDSKLTVNLGNVEIEKVSNAYIDAKVDLGDVDISNNNRKASHTLTIKGDMGDVQIGN